IPEFAVSAKDQPIWIVRLLTASGMASSGGQARRLIAGGGVKINGQKVTDDSLELKVEGELVMKIGKKRFLKVVPGS
ncbi:RNA-binding S4 domain-containing protein, partial [bacterium]|nr:RNA-binding S4 domain-containing protein [bacterium]